MRKDLPRQYRHVNRHQKSVIVLSYSVFCLLDMLTGDPIEVANVVKLMNVWY